MKTVTKSADPPRTHLAYATFAISVGAFLLGLYAVARPPPLPEKPAAGAQATDTRPIEDAITRLRRDVDALQQGGGGGGAGADAVVLQRLSALEAAVARGGDPRAAGGAASAGRARYKSLSSSTPAISVVQNKDGTFSVTSTDAALTGKPISVDAVREDGKVDTYTIVAPPPGAPASR
jgi:hypothetical protein